MTSARLRVALVLLPVIVSGLWYLRDPAWLATETTGLRGWRQGPDGTRYRWSGGHASFFVPSSASSAAFRIATSFDESDRRPMIAEVTLDDQTVARVLLTDASWRRIEIPLPPPASRRFRRVDVRTNIVRDGNQGVMISDLIANR
jgi:hypothetical protein